MKRTKKVIAGALIAATILTVGGVSAYAASHEPNCSSKLQRVECIGPYSYYAYESHVLYESANDTVICGKTAMHGAHDLYCSNSDCGVYIGRSFRTHKIIHQYCLDETGVCQY